MFYHRRDERKSHCTYCARYDIPTLKMFGKVPIAKNCKHLAKLHFPKNCKRLASYSIIHIIIMFENYILNSNPQQWGINLALDTKYYYIKFLLCFRELRVIQQDKIIIKFYIAFLVSQDLLRQFLNFKN